VRGDGGRSPVLEAHVRLVEVDVELFGIWSHGSVGGRVGWRSLLYAFVDEMPVAGTCQHSI
jgi:hypothetical protein